MKLGIDFGTTRTVVSVCDRGNYPVVGFEGPDGDGLDWVPTVVASDGTRRVYGAEALQRLHEGWDGLRSFKRLLSGDAGPDQTVRLGGEDLPVTLLITEFLVALREQLLTASNLPVSMAEGEELQAMIAVPANASSTQRFLTLEAFRSAGFTVVGVMNEPSAAGVEYAHRYRNTLNRNRERVLVYDLGGGTFDASLVDLGDGSHRVLAHAGLSDLGGDDFDAVLLELALASAGRESPAGTDRTRLLDHCRAVKETLTPSTRKVVVDVSEDTSVTVQAADLYAAAAPLVHRTLDSVASVLPGDDAAAAPTDAARFDTSGLAGVYIVGGASDLPVVARTLREAFGRRVRRSAYPSAATAVGLAIAADLGAELEVDERFSRTFGVFRELRDGAAVAFDAILTDGLEVPAGGGSWVRRYRAAHNVGHFRYAEVDAVTGRVPTGRIVPWGEIRFAFDEALRDVQDLAAVPVRRVDGPGPLIEERYTVDDHGMVQVRITDLDSGYAAEHRLG